MVTLVHDRLHKEEYASIMMRANPGATIGSIGDATSSESIGVGKPEELESGPKTTLRLLMPQDVPNEKVPDDCSQTAGEVHLTSPQNINRRAEETDSPALLAHIDALEKWRKNVTEARTKLADTLTRVQPEIHKNEAAHALLSGEMLRSGTIPELMSEERCKSLAFR